MRLFRQDLARTLQAKLDERRAMRYNCEALYEVIEMPTFLSHAVTGLAAGSFPAPKSYSWKTAVLCMACAVAPDLDSAAFRIGIPYSHWLGHRGFFHSLTFASVLATLALTLMRKAEPRGRIRAQLWTAFFVSAASHGLLDAMTNGGLGIAFFSPFDTTRCFLPWRPIEVSPISVTGFFSNGGADVLRSEFKWVMVPAILVMIGVRLGRKVRRENATGKRQN